MNRNREDMTLTLADALDAVGKARADDTLKYAATHLRRLVLESIEADTAAMELRLRANKLDDAP